MPPDELLTELSIANSPPLDRLSLLYQALRINWRASGRAEDASWAYVQERRTERAMHAPWLANRYFGREITGLAGWRCWLGWTLFYTRHSAYWLLSYLADFACGYGERPWNAALVSFLVIWLFRFLYEWCGGVIANGASSNWGYFIYSLNVFTTMGTGNYRTINWQADLLSGIEAAVGIALFALFIFALGNRISRL